MLDKASRGWQGCFQKATCWEGQVSWKNLLQQKHGLGFRRHNSLHVQQFEDAAFTAIGEKRPESAGTFRIEDGTWVVTSSPRQIRRRLL